ncbi:MAG: hypothetical protein DBX47_03045 [Clostridiales bacterium]|nr:MAG: hypothetical protein DBX47_03045 [Clostridiales bacterium]
MNKILILMGVQLKSTFRTNSSKRKKSPLPAIGAIVLFSLLGIFMAVSFFTMFFGISMAFKESGLPSYYTQIIAYILAAVLMLFFTTFQAQATVFRAKDLDMLMAMPVTPFQILMSKISAFYLSNLLFGSIVLAPAAVATIICEGFSAYILIVLLLNLLTIPCITMTISFILAFLLSLIPEKSKFNRFFTTFISFVFLGAYFLFYSKLTDMINSFISNSNEFISGAKYYPPILFLNNALEGDWISLVLLVLISVLVFLAFMYILSKTYFPLIRKNSRSKSKQKQLSLINEKQSPVWMAVFKKELGKYFSTSIYVINTAFGIILLLGLSVASLFGDSFIEGFSAALAEGGANIFLFLATAAACALILTTSTTCVSISLEGKNFWILRTSPISTRDMLIGKALVNIIVIEPLWLISSIILTFGLQLSFIHWLVMFLAGTAAAVLCALFGLLMNLLFPKLDAVNETQVVKQSMASMLGIFGGVIISIPAFIGAYFICIFSPIIAVLAITVYYILASFIIYILLRCNSEKLIKRIIC